MCWKMGLTWMGPHLSAWMWWVEWPMTLTKFINVTLGYRPSIINSQLLIQQCDFSLRMLSYVVIKHGLPH